MISSLELARICGVSQGTVDRALHGRPGIAQATREAILEAAKRHGYAPNPAAREMMTGRNSICGAIIPASSGVFFMDLFEELRQALKRRGLKLLIAPASNAEETLEALRDMAARRVGGIALVPPSDDFEAPLEVTSSANVVALASPCRGRKVSYIAPDEVPTGFDGAAFLWSLGHRKIACLSYARKARAIEERREGYVKFMEGMGAKPEILAPATPESILAFVKGRRPTALLCHNDWLALTALRTLEAHGIKVPGDMSILGVDDSPTFTALCPEMSTMSYPYAAIAEEAAKAMAGEKPSKARIPKLEIVSRRTTAAI